MYNRFQQVFSVAMAMLVLFSTLSFSIEKQYCGGNLVDFSVFTDVKNCCSEAPDKDLSKIVQSCCKEVVHLIEGQDVLSLEKTNILKTSQKIFILSFTHVFGGIQSLESQKEPLVKHYTPPNFVRDIQVLHEIFLI